MIEEALRRQLQADDLGELIQRVRTRSGLSDQKALELAYSELKAMTLQRRFHAIVRPAVTLARRSGRDTYGQQGQRRQEQQDGGIQNS